MLKPEVSIGVGLATAAIVLATYSHSLPSVADVRTASPNDTDINAARRTASWTSAGVVAAVSLIAKDPTVFVIGGGMVIALDWWHRYADQVNPLIKAVPGAGPASPTVGVTPTQTSTGDVGGLVYN
jgi:hypothetical protein